MSHANPGSEMMSQRTNWTRMLMCMVLFALALGTSAVRAADEQDPNDPALKKAGKKMTQEQLIRIRIAELESGAISESLKTPESVVLSGPPLTDREKVIHVLNRLSFGWTPGEIDEVLKAGGWEKWVKQQLEPEKIDDSKLDALLAKRYAFRKKS